MSFDAISISSSSEERLAEFTAWAREPIPFERLKPMAKTIKKRLEVLEIGL
jgi:hypothetical protein